MNWWRTAAISLLALTGSIFIYFGSIVPSNNKFDLRELKYYPGNIEVIAYNKYSGGVYVLEYNYKKYIFTDAGLMKEIQ